VRSSQQRHSSEHSSLQSLEFDLYINEDKSILAEHLRRPSLPRSKFSHSKGELMASTTLIPAARYLRMSTDNQRLSLAAQAALIKHYADAHGFDVVQTYEDAGKSGLTLKRREGLAQLLHDVVKGDAGYKAILVYDVSRWGRFQDADEAAHYEFVCRSAGVPVYYCAESFGNDCSPPNVIMKTLKRVMAGEYSRELSGRLRRTKKINAQAGFWNGGPPPYGFRRMIVNFDGSPKRLLKDGEVKSLAGGRVVLVPGTAKEVSRVVEIFRLRLQEGWSTKTIAAQFNRKRLKCRGRPWTCGQVLNILRHPTYTGCLTWGRSTGLLGGKRIRVSKQRWTLKPKAFPEIIDQNTFDTAQDTFARRTINRSNDELLNGLRSVLAAHGRLSSDILNASREIPGAATYSDRFGTLSRAYQLIGYGVDENRAALWKTRRRLAQIKGRVMKQILRALPGQVSLIRQPPGIRKLLSFQDGIKVSVLACQCVRTPLGDLRWIVPVIGAEKQYPALLCRCDVKNKAVKDLYLVPNTERGSRFRLKDNDEWLKTGKRITHFAELRGTLETLRECPKAPRPI